MEFDFAEVLLQVMERNASDLHLTAGSPPMIRHHGRLHALDYPRLTPQTTREVVYSILTNDQRQKLETDWQIDLAYSIPGKARFRVNAFFQRASMSAAFRLIPSDMPKLGLARAAAGARGLHQEAARLRAGHRARRAPASRPRSRRCST